MKDNKILNIIVIFVLGGAGILASILFLNNISLPLKTGISLLFLIALTGFIFTRVNYLSLLPRLMITLYILPFTVMIGYIFIDGFEWAYRSLAIELASDRLLLEQMIHVGIVGIVGLLLGMQLANYNKKKPNVTVNNKRNIYIKKHSLTLLIFSVGLVLSVFLSWLGAPTKSIFEASYASEGTSSLSISLKFYAAQLTSYLILILLFVDAEEDIYHKKRKFIKYILIICAATFIVIFLQLLRGDRESIGLVVGLMSLYLTSSGFVKNYKIIKSHINKKIRSLFIPSVAIFFIFVGLGAIRFQVVGSDISSIDFTSSFLSGLTKNTWTGVFHTHLGIISEYRFGPMEYYYGKTYLDYLLSIPPGIIANTLGIVRPIDTMQGPAWWFPGVSGGGYLTTVVPFKNFGIFGVLVILSIFGYLFAVLEIKNVNNQFWNRLFYGAIATTSFRWFWYGDMSMIRTIMIVVILGVIYKFIVRIKLDATHSINKISPTNQYKK